MKIFSFKQEYNNLTSLEQIVRELNLPSVSISSGDIFSAKDLKGTDVFIFPYDVIGKTHGERTEPVKDFVKEGGICWIMNQRQRGWYSHFLPPELADVELENRYIDLDASRTRLKPYISPWILEREHPIYNKPNYIDEGDFVFWKIKVLGDIYETTATHVVFLPSSWDILGGFADQKIKLKDRAALIAEARYGKGLFFWTQVFSPEITWRGQKDFTKRFLQNILTYFQDFRKNKVFRVKIKPKPWAILSGEKIKIEIKPKKEVKSVDLEILTPKGKKVKTKTLDYTPSEGGTYKVKAKIRAKDGRFTYAHTFFKVTKGFTPFRFLTHVHFQTDWTPEHLGTLYGICRRLNIDGVVLAEGYFYWDRKLSLKIKAQLNRIDNPAVRFFPGEEIHPMHNYTLEEGGTKEDSRRHVTTVGYMGICPYATKRWDEKDLARIHQNKGIAIVAHPHSQPWWVEPQEGHNFEAIEVDRTNPKIWDKMLKKGKVITGISGFDNLVEHRFFFRSINTGWFDQPFDLNSLIDTILKGRITKIITFPHQLRANKNYLFFSINNQITGGTVYAVDKVELQVRVRSHLPLRFMRIVKDGNRNYKKIKINAKVINCQFQEEIKRDTYWRIEIDCPDQYFEYSCPTFTNPIFVKKIRGPKGSYFYFQNQAPFFFSQEKGRFLANLTQLKRVKFHDNIWEISFFEPGEGKIFIGAEDIKEIELDGRKKAVRRRHKGEIIIPFLEGEHKVRIKL